jgi:hypothetical protein
MSMTYFKPTDLKKLGAAFNYIAKSGVGFAVTEDGEQVFISARDVNALGLSLGDTLQVLALDNYAAPETSHYTSRWRAVRIEMIQRLDDVVRDLPNAAPAVPAAPVPAPLPIPIPFPAPVPAPAPTPEPVALTDAAFLAQLVAQLLEPKPWTSRGLTDALRAADPAMAALPLKVLQQKVINKLNTMHKTGEVSVLKICAKGGQDMSSAVYYAKDVDVFYEHLDAPLNDDE